MDRPPQFSKGTKFWEYGSISFPYYVNGCRWRFLSTNFIVNVTQTSSMGLASANGTLPKKTVEALLSVNLSLFPIFPANTLFLFTESRRIFGLTRLLKKSCFNLLFLSSLLSWQDQMVHLNCRVPSTVGQNQNIVKAWNLYSPCFLCCLCDNNLHKCIIWKYKYCCFHAQAL